MTDQLIYAEEELLASHAFAEPLVADGGRCHGGFDDDGVTTSRHARSPRAARSTRGKAQHEADVRHRDPRHRPRGVPARTYPERRPGQAADRATASPEPGHRHAHPHRHRRGVRLDAPLRRSSPTCSATSTRTSTGTAIGAPRPRPHRGPRPRRGRLRRRGRPQPDVVRRPRHRVREPGHRRPDRADARAHGPRPARAAPLRSTSAPCGRRRWPTARFPTTSTSTSRRCSSAWSACCSSRSRRSTPSGGPRRCSPTPSSCAGDGEAARLVSLHPRRRDAHVEYLKTVLSEMRDRTFVGDGGARARRAPRSSPAIWDRAVAEQRGIRSHEVLRPRSGVRSTRAIEPAPGTDATCSGSSTRSARLTATPDGVWTEVAARRRHEVRDLLRAPAAPPVGRRRRAAAGPGRARPGRAAPTSSASTTCGRSSTTSSRSTRHSSAPEVFLAAA